MKPSWKQGYALVVSVLCACSFGGTQTWVTWGSTQIAASAALNRSGEYLFVHDGVTGALEAHVPGVDSHVASTFVGTSISGSPVALGPDAVDPSGVVALLRDGRVRGYAVSGGAVVSTWTVAARPAPPRTPRVFCDVEHTESGDLYVTSIDGAGSNRQAVLARRTAAGVWSTVTLGGLTCPWVAYDDELDVVVVARGMLLEKFTPTLGAQGEVLADFPWGNMDSFDVLGGVVFAAGPSGPTGEYRDAWMFALADGALLDDEIVEMGWMGSAQIVITDTGAVGLLAGEPLEPTAGRATVMTIDLLE